MSASNVVETQVADAIAALTAALDGKYVIREPIGFGRGGVTVRARAVDSEESVVLKVAWNDAVSRARVSRETEFTSKVVHPNVLPVHEIETANGLRVSAMPLVLGGSLGDLVDTRKPVPYSRVLEILQVVADALDQAHAAGVIHGALSPEKILLDEAGKPLITDFALRAPRDSRDALSPSAIGAPAYMSPEQRHNGPTDGRTDQYALAIIAYELLRGERTWRLNEEGVLEIDGLDIMLHRPVAPGAALNASGALRRATARDAAFRYPSVRAFVRSFAGQETGEQPVVQHAVADNVPLTAKRSRFWLVLPLVVTLVGFASRQSVRDQVINWWFSDWSLLRRQPQVGNEGSGLRTSGAAAVETQRSSETQPADESRPVTNTRAADPSPTAPGSSVRPPEGSPRQQAPPINTSPNTQIAGGSRRGDTAGAVPVLRVTPGGVNPSNAPRPGQTPTAPAAATNPAQSRPTTGGIAVIFEGPVRATVLIDGEPRGETPLVWEGAPGRHVVTLRGIQGFTPAQITVNLTAGDTVRAAFSPR
jgi:serine/threonine protein kinase